jgi:sugar phosphate isomerase/epimerase
MPRAATRCTGTWGPAPPSCWVGRRSAPTRTVAENLVDAEKVLTPLVERGVSVMVENCPKVRLVSRQSRGQLAYSPELCEWMFDLGLDLIFDPSHLPGVGIDPVGALRPHVDRVVHVQAKDVEVFPDLCNRAGYLGPVHRADPADAGQVAYRVVDRRRLVDVLYEGGFDGVVSVEHEDPVCGRARSRRRPVSGSPIGP